jgi:hypothetical protein
MGLDLCSLFPGSDLGHFSTDGYARYNDVLVSGPRNKRHQISQRVGGFGGIISKVITRILLIFGLVSFLARSVWADGGTIRFQGDAGSFHVTVFTLPPILAAGAVDVTVLLQDRSKLEPLLDANVTFDLTAESGAARQTAAWLPPACAMNPPASLAGIPATLNRGENRLLYRAYVQIPHSGSWNLKIHIRRGDEFENVATLLPVNPPAPPVLAYWQLFMLPFVGVLGFIVNRSARSLHRSKIPEDF